MLIEDVDPHNTRAALAVTLVFGALALLCIGGIFTLFAATGGSHAGYDGNDSGGYVIAYLLSLTAVACGFVALALAPFRRTQLASGGLQALGFTLLMIDYLAYG